MSESDQADPGDGMPGNELWPKRRRQNLSGYFRIDTIIYENPAIDHSADDWKMH